MPNLSLAPDHNSHSGRALWLSGFSRKHNRPDFDMLKFSLKQYTSVQGFSDRQQGRYFFHVARFCHTTTTTATTTSLNLTIFVKITRNFEK